MTTRQILQCVLILVVLALAGCEREPTKTGPEKNSATKASVSANPDAAATSQPSSIQRENKGNEARDNETQEGRTDNHAIKQGDDGNKQPARESGSPKPASANPAVPATEKQANEDRPQNPSDKSDDSDKLQRSETGNETGEPAYLDWVIFGLEITGGLVVLAILVMGFLHFRNQSKHHLETNIAKAAGVQLSVARDAQKEILDKLSSLSSAQSETSARLSDVHTEVRSLARLVRESSFTRGDHRGPVSVSSSSAHQPSPPKEEPEFPVSAGDYLGKMTRFANVVRPDFQNGILVSDPDGQGELMLIRDSRLPDETQPLFVVPRYAQFQTKQDFYTYYEKYYDCSRPSAGDVWIIEPAVVQNVSGGWQLREKGVLEIR